MGAVQVPAITGHHAKAATDRSGKHDGKEKWLVICIREQ